MAVSVTQGQNLQQNLTEIGEEDARRFVVDVGKLARRTDRVVILYSSNQPLCSGWVKNPIWRSRVLGELHTSSLFSRCEFLPPCHLDDDWVFAGYITQASRTLENLLFGRVP